MIQGAGGQLVRQCGRNWGVGGGWGSDGQGAVTGVAVVAVGVTTIEVAVAEAATVGAATRSLQQWDAVLAVWCTSGMAYMRVREVVVMAVMWPPLSCQVKMRRKKQKKTYLNVFVWGWVWLQLLGV